MRETAKPSAQTVLRPCPCCGGEARYNEYSIGEGYFGYSVGEIICVDCGMRTRHAPVDGTFGVEWTEADFAALWNRRADDGKVDLLDVD